MCFPRDSARVCCEERAQARRQAHHASRLVGGRKESSALMRRTAGMVRSGKAALSSGLPFHRSSNERMRPASSSRTCSWLRTTMQPRQRWCSSTRRWRCCCSTLAAQSRARASTRALHGMLPQLPLRRSTAPQRPRRSRHRCTTRRAAPLQPTCSKPRFQCARRGRLAAKKQTAGAPCRRSNTACCLGQSRRCWSWMQRFAGVQGCQSLSSQLAACGRRRRWREWMMEVDGLRNT